MELLYCYFFSCNPRSVYDPSVRENKQKAFALLHEDFRMDDVKMFLNFCIEQIILNEPCCL